MRRWKNGDSPVLVIHDGVTESIFAHLIPAKRVDFPSCEKVVKMIVKDLDTLGYNSVVFRCDNEPSILALLRAVKLAWTGDVVQKTSAEGDPQSNGAAESSVNVVKGHDLLTWLVPFAASMHRRFAVGRDGEGEHTNEMWEGALFSPLAQFGERSVVAAHAAIQPSSGFTISTRKVLGTDGWIEHSVYWHRQVEFVKARTIKRLPPGERWTGSLLDEALGSELTPNALEDDKQFLCLHLYMSSDMCES